MGSNHNNHAQDNAERCKRWRKRILEVSQLVPAAHVAPAFSCVEIVDALYHDIMGPDDTFVMSKGHGWLAQAVILEAQGKVDLNEYCQGGVIGAHPDRELVGASTGSLGHGLGLCVGMVLADRIRGASRRVYCLLSDGEMQEGSTWEAIRFIGEQSLTGLITIIDKNNLAGLEEPYWPRVDEDDFTVELTDGNDNDDIWDAITTWTKERPLFLVCNTIKGKGVSFMENNPIWHYRSPNKEEYAQALAELGG